jgi:hypothetical protein
MIFISLTGLINFAVVFALLTGERLKIAYGLAG